jgi:hypothetical protein
MTVPSGGPGPGDGPDGGLGEGFGDAPGGSPGRAPGDLPGSRGTGVHPGSYQAFEECGVGFSRAAPPAPPFRPAPSGLRPWMSRLMHRLNPQPSPGRAGTSLRHGPLLRGRSPLLFLLMLGVGAAGCDSGAPESPGSIQGQVLGEGEPLAGVTVELTGPVNRVSNTDAQGQYRFEGVPTGAYVVSIRNLPPDAAFPAVSRTASVSPGGGINLDFSGSFIRTASITGEVVARDLGVAGVTVTLTGPDASTVQTGSSGTFSFPALRAGDYQVEISGFPSSVSFPATQTSVALQPGQGRTVRFEGDPELTASATIREVNRVLPGGTREPVDPREVRGLIEVAVTLDRGQDRVDSLLVTLGNRLVGKQVFSDAVLPGGEGVPPSESSAGEAVAGSVVELVFPIETDAFDAETGAPRHPNGDQLLTVRLASREGGASAFTAQLQLTLANRDTFVTFLDPERGPVADAQGNPWMGGRLDVRVLPVLYTPGRTVNQVTLELRQEGGTLVARSGAVGTSPLLVRFPVTEPGEASLAGYETPPGGGDRLQVVQARYTDGTSVPSLPRVTAQGLRFDQRPPGVEAFELPRQGAAQRCCLENWVGADFAFADALRGLTETGVGGLQVRVHAGAASLSDAELLALPPVTRGEDLAASVGNSSYRALARVEDALGNARTLALAPSPGNPLSGGAGSGGALFGVDLAPPTAQLAAGGGTLLPFSVNPPGGAAWGVVAEDPATGPGGARSGFGPAPLEATVVRFGAGDEPSGSCLFGIAAAGACNPAPSGLIRPLPTDPGVGYLRFRARGVDRAGNVSQPVEAWALQDPVPPLVPSLFLASTPVGGAPVTVVAELSDNVDLFRARALVRFRFVPSQGEAVERLLPAATPPIRVGTPFDLDPVRQASVQSTFPWILGVQLAASGPDGEAPGGPVLPVDRLTVVAEDAAGNQGEGAIPVSPPDPSSLRGFGPGVRGADGVARWRGLADRTTACRAPGPPGVGGNAGVAPPTCPSGTSGPLTLQAEARMVGAAGGEPFALVAWVAVPAAGGLPRFLAGASSVLASQDGGVAVYLWETQVTLPDDLAPGSWAIRVLGVDAEGNGLLAGPSFPLEVVQGTP